MSTTVLFTALLESSRSEQMPVSIYLTSTVLHGIVSNIHPGAAEIKTHDGRRCVIAIDKIEAIEAL
jgi:host factor-I protein